jgi:hypothetical protein
MKATQVLKKIGTALGIKVALEQVKLLDGVTILEADSFAVGSEVFIVMDEEFVALPLGEYELEDGRKLLVESEGIIASITDAGAEAETTETPVVEEVTQGAERLPKRIVKSNVEEHHFAEETTEVAPTDVVTAVEEAEAVVTEEVVAIISELTPESVSESDASEIASNVISIITDVLTELPEEVSAKAFAKHVKYGKNKLSEDEAQVITDVADTLISAITEVVDASTPTEVTPEISTEIATTIIDAVTEIVSAEETLSKSVFRRAKTKMNKVKNSKVQQRVAQAQAKINLMKTQTKTSAKKVIKFNPENKKKTEVKFRVAQNRPESYMDKVINKLFN